MIDPENALLGESRSNRVIDLAAGFEVAAERLFKRHAHGRAGEPGSFEPVNHRLEQRRRGRQEDRNAVAGIADRRRQAIELAALKDVRWDVEKPSQKALGDFRLIEIRRKMVL
jgi:hypothetical protein